MRHGALYSRWMAHPIMFRDDDPLLGRVRRIAMGFPGAREKISHGRPSFYTTKIFAYYGGSVKVDGVWVQHEESIMVLPDQAERQAILSDSRVYVPGYLGAYGWIGLDLAAAEAGWPEVAELIDASFRNTAPPRLIAELGGSIAVSGPDRDAPDRRG